MEGYILGISNNYASILGHPFIYSCVSSPRLVNQYGKWIIFTIGCLRFCMYEPVLTKQNQRRIKATIHQYTS